MSNTHMGRRRVSLLAAMLMMGAVLVGPAIPGGAVDCYHGAPDVPTINSAFDVETYNTAWCTAVQAKTLKVQIRRLRTLWPDSVVAVAQDGGTKTSWQATPSGCEASASGSSHRYKGVSDFTGMATEHSSWTWLTCY